MTVIQKFRDYILPNPWFGISCFFAIVILAIGIVKKRLVLIPVAIVNIISVAIIVYIWHIIEEEKEQKKWSKVISSIQPKVHSGNDCGLYSGHSLYRLGDMIRTNWRWKEKGESYHLENFPDSIASEYMRKTQKQNNYDVLLNIIKSRTEKSKDLPGNQDIVVHLRVGDVVENNPVDVNTILSSYTYINGNIWSNYTAPLRHIANKVLKVDPNQVNKIVLVAGSHIKIPTPKSCEYIDIIKKYFEDTGYKVELRLGGGPDSDFIYMCNASYFIPATNGGYTNLIKNVVHHLDNVVL